MTLAGIPGLVLLVLNKYIDRINNDFGGLPGLFCICNSEVFTVEEISSGTTL